MIGRRSFALAGLGLAAGLPARAQNAPPELREELMALEREGWEALKERDRPTMRRLLADDALLIFSDGARYYKSQLLEHMLDYRLDSYSIDPNYGMRRLDLDVAALIYRVTSRGAARFDRTETSKVLVTSLYVRRDGRWRSVLYQETPAVPSNLLENHK
jgi:hypothetical protein